MSKLLSERLCTYLYDPLDRQVNCVPFEQAGVQFFYSKTQLITEIQDRVQRSILKYDDQLLAQHQCEGMKTATALLATDQQRSVLHAVNATHLLSPRYTPYGHRQAESILPGLLGFNGEQPDQVTGHYHLGNGYRQFNPALMRFNSPDSWSPFGKGELNPYMYCAGDPVNQSDPTGHFAIFALKAISGMAIVIGGAGALVSSFVSEIPDEVKYGFMALAGIGLLGTGASAAFKFGKSINAGMAARAGRTDAMMMGRRGSSISGRITRVPSLEGRRNLIDPPPQYWQWPDVPAGSPPPYSATGINADQIELNFRRGSHSPPPSYPSSPANSRRGSQANRSIRNGE